MKDGDIIGFSGCDPLSVGIQIASLGVPYLSPSHVGLYFGGRLYESTSLGVGVDGVRDVTLSKRLDDYPRVWHYPLTRTLYPHETTRLQAFLESVNGRPYDFKGAAGSAGMILSWVGSKLKRTDLSTLFCSELVAAAYNEIGLWPVLNPAKYNPTKLIRRLKWAGLLRHPNRLN